MHAIYVHDTQLAHPKFSRAKSYARSRTPQNSQNMGGIVSNPLDDAKRQEIQDTVEEVMGVFSKEFAMGYKTALIDKIRAEKEEKHAKGGYEYQLVDPPKDATVIKAGYITKRGDVKKNWLKRYFVALNEADNYDILYFDKQVDDAKFAVGDDLTRSRASMAEPQKVCRVPCTSLEGLDHHPLTTPDR